MPILMVMLNDDIKTSDAYMKYLTKAKGGKPAKGHGKGLLTKQHVKVVVERVSIPKRRRLKTMIEETDQSEKVADTIDLEEIEEEDEIPLVPDGLNQKGPNEGSGVILEVLDELKGSSSTSSSESNDEIEDISSDEERSEADNTKKSDEEKIEKPAATLISSSLTLSSIKYGNQFLNDNPDISLTDALKERVEVEVQPLVNKSKKPETHVDNEVLDNILTRLEKKVEAMSKFNIPDAIDKSVQAHLKKNVLPKDVPDFL
ncbi:hypothetical protein Tco_1385492 [Tanacetum coccineum]